MRRSAAAVAFAALALVAGMTPSHAADLVYVSGPGGNFVNYTVPVLVIAAGDTVTYTNIDIANHDVVSHAKGPDTPICAEAQIPTGQCPLFWSQLIGVAASSPIYGIETVPSGAIETFFCSIHSNMQGTLVVL